MLDMAIPVITEHHYQRIDLEDGYLQATRDDTSELQDFRINAYWKDGTLIKSARRLYNIKYDYFRYQTWKGAAPIQDEIPTSFGYGHLQWENSVGEMGPDWENPYPDNYEPVKPEGNMMFHNQGARCSFFCVELDVSCDLRFYIWEDIEEVRKKGLKILTDVRHMDRHFVDSDREEEQEAIRNFDPEQARRQRIEGIKLNTQYLRCELEKPDYQNAVRAAHAKEIDIEVPLDPRFID